MTDGIIPVKRQDPGHRNPGRRVPGAMQRREPNGFMQPRKPLLRLDFRSV